MTCRIAHRGSRGARAWSLALLVSAGVAACEVVSPQSGGVSPAPPPPGAGVAGGTQPAPGRPTPSQPGTTPQPPPPQPVPAARLGTVTPTAGHVSLNGRPLPASAPLNNGDKVATDSTGRAHIELSGRGTVDLETGTDPRFVLEGACVLVRIFFGAALVSGSRLCVEDEDGTRVALSSAIHIHVAPGRTSITVVDGTVQLQRVGRLQKQETLLQLQKITVVNGQLQQRVTVPRGEVDLIRRRFVVPAQPVHPVQPPPQIIR